MDYKKKEIKIFKIIVRKLDNSTSTIWMKFHFASIDIIINEVTYITWYLIACHCSYHHYFNLFDCSLFSIYIINTTIVKHFQKSNKRHKIINRTGLLQLPTLCETSYFPPQQQATPKLLMKNGKSLQLLKKGKILPSTENAWQNLFSKHVTQGWEKQLSLIMTNEP